MSVDNQFLIQCNATRKTGLGHLSRCLNIANAIKYTSKNVKIIFNGIFDDFAILLLNNSGFEYIFTKNLNKYKGYTLILDDYDVSQNDINIIREKVNKFIKVDDFNTHELKEVDLVINFRLNAETENYSSINSCLGLSYFPFKLPLMAIRERNIKVEKKNIENIFILMGATDEVSDGKNIIRLLNQIVENKHIHLIDKKFEGSCSEKSEKNKLTYLPFTSNIEKYYELADIFISGGGLTKYEAAYCCIPNATLSRNEGQASDTRILSKCNLTYDIGSSEQLKNYSENVKNKLFKFFDSDMLSLIRQCSKNNFVTTSTLDLAKIILRT